MPLTLLVGGARSGKSSTAVRLAKEWAGHVSVIVTAEARDEEMARRIAAHQAERPWDWTVIEEPRVIGDVLRRLDDGSLVLIDCLTLWVSNMMESGSGDQDIIETARKDAAEAAGRSSPVIVVSNEVGSGIVPFEVESRRYRDLLGAVNAAWADAADRSYLMVAGKALELTDVPKVGREG
jgi:adenosyl cobinamide kinase/adenosyl cobinamide phosphate guanylyltransferase